jgi:uncharacterized RDD family membrane protein YckC
MENRIRYTKIKRFLAFLFDFVFILFFAFAIDMVIGLIYPIDTDGFRNLMIYPLLVIIIPYIFFGELLFRNTLGKYLFGIEIVDIEQYERPPLSSFVKRGLLKILFPIEGLVLLFSKSKKRLGDIWAKTFVVNKVSNKLNPYIRLIIGFMAIIAIYFSFSISMGLAIKKTDFYRVGIDYLKSTRQVEITGLPQEVVQSGNNASFGVPVSNEDHDKYAIVNLELIEGEWRVDHVDFLKVQVAGPSFSFNFSSRNQ